MNPETLSKTQLKKIADAANMDRLEILVEKSGTPKGKRRALLVARYNNRTSIIERCNKLLEKFSQNNLVE